MAGDYKRLIKDQVLDEDAFIKATFSGRRRGHVPPWVKVVLRPVLIKDGRHIQFSYFEQAKNITRNYAGPILEDRLEQLLELPFKSIQVQTTGGNFQVQITKKGRAIIHHHRPAGPPVELDLAHDRRKNYPLPAGQPDPFLQAIGVMTQSGQIKASRQRKFRQINEFLRLIEQTGQLDEFNASATDPLQVVDLGCGSADLTFATYHYLSHILGLPVQMTGVDVKADLLKKHARTVEALGWPHLNFEAARIIDFEPARPPAIVLALHACDTATDEALAQGIRWQSKLILSAPCCHHHLQRQLQEQSPPSPFGPVLRQGILKERLGDILTDTFRALILQIAGYQTDVVEFVSSEHTAKNLLIRAVKTRKPGNSKIIEEYKALKELWGVTPYLEGLSG